VTRTCPRHPAEPTLTPSLSYCRTCLQADIMRDRENRRAAEQLYRQQVRHERRETEQELPDHSEEPAAP
jgi:hypothetical protein